MAILSVTDGLHRQAAVVPLALTLTLVPLPRLNTLAMRLRTLPRVRMIITSLLLPRRRRRATSLPQWMSWRRAFSWNL
jgi:hypothetical protein